MKNQEKAILMRSFALSSIEILRSGLLSNEELLEIQVDIKNLDCSYMEGVRMIKDLTVAINNQTN